MLPQLSVALLSLLVGCGDHDAGTSAHAISNPTPIGTPVVAPLCANHVELRFDGPEADIDVGFTGFTYGTRLHDGIVLALDVGCAANGPDCGACTLTGPARSTQGRATRRCATDMRRVCDRDDECGTGACVDFLGPPLGLTGGGSTSCVDDEIAQVGPGTFVPATGAIELPLALRWTFYDTIDLAAPCPRCTGARLGGSGACDAGLHQGETCIVDATDDLLGNTSFDCPPFPTATIATLNLPMDLTTGISRLPPAERCTLEPSTGLACYCAEQPLVNLCAGGQCDLEADGDAVCSDGPLDGSCVRESFRGCLRDADCPAADDHCVTHARGCSGTADGSTGNSADLQRTGVADPAIPVLVSTFCVPAAHSDVADVGIGLPGPAAVRFPMQVTATRQ